MNIFLLGDVVYGKRLSVDSFPGASFHEPLPSYSLPGW